MIQSVKTFLRQAEDSFLRVEDVIKEAGKDLKGDENLDRFELARGDIRKALNVLLKDAQKAQKLAQQRVSYWVEAEKISLPLPPDERSLAEETAALLRKLYFVYEPRKSYHKCINLMASILEENIDSCGLDKDDEMIHGEIFCEEVQPEEEK